MAEKTIESVLARVKKMIALGTDSGATEGERENAMRMAHNVGDIGARRLRGLFALETFVAAAQHHEKPHKDAHRDGSGDAKDDQLGFRHKRPEIRLSFQPKPPLPGWKALPSPRWGPSPWART